MGNVFCTFSVKRIFFYVLPLLFYMLIIFSLSSISKYPDVCSWFLSLDKLIHAIEYYLLGYLIMRLLMMSSTRAFSWIPALMTISLGFIFAASDEWHQSFVPGRDMSVFDLFADILGVSLAVFTYPFVRYKIGVVRKIENSMEKEELDG